MELHTLVQLTTGVTLLTCVLAVAGVHTYASGRAQRALGVAEAARRLPGREQLMPGDRAGGGRAAGRIRRPFRRRC